MKKTLLFSIIAYFGLVNAQLFVSDGSYVMVSDAYIFSNSYVNNAGNPTNGSNVYLRRDGQLFQGGTTSTNAGIGSLSVYQEGTSSNFQHNAWCSPVGNPTGTGNQPFGITLLNRPSSITGFSAINALPLTALNGSNTGTAPNITLNIASRWIHTYQNSSSYAGWFRNGASTTIAPGLGFSMKGSDSGDATIPFTGAGANNPGNQQRYEFRGRPNTGDVTFSITGSPAGYNAATPNVNAPIRTLIGNPYPSAMDLNLFFNGSLFPGIPANSSTTAGGTNALEAAAYFWEQANVTSHNLNAYQGGYATWAPTGGAGTYVPAAFWTYNGDGTYNTGGVGTGASNTRRRFLPIGQGFMVQSKVFDGSRNFTIRNAHRVFVKEGAGANDTYNTIRNSNFVNNCNQFYPDIPNIAGIDYTTIESSGPPQLQIYAVVNNGGVLPTALAFRPDASDNFENGFDAVNINATPAGFYYVVPDRSNEEFVISTTNFAFDKMIPVGFRCNETTNFKVNIAETLNCFDENIIVYIFDRLHNTYHDIKNKHFEIDLRPGVYNNRFFITFKNNNSNNPISPVLSNSIILIQNNDMAKLTLINSDNQNIKEFLMYDTAGRLLINKKDLGSDAEYIFDTQIYPEGVYLTKTILSDNSVKNEKIIIDN